MNKTDAVEYLKNKGLEAISVTTLDRHRKEGRVEAGQKKGKTGLVVDYSQEALDAYFDAEQEALSNPVTVVPSIVTSPSSAKSSQALARLPFQPIKGEIQVVEVIDESSQSLVKPMTDLRQLKAKLVWTLDEASAMTGFPKGRIREAIEAGELKGKRIGRPFFVRPKDVEEWVASLF